MGEPSTYATVSRRTLLAGGAAGAALIAAKHFGSRPASVTPETPAAVLWSQYLYDLIAIEGLTAVMASRAFAHLSLAMQEAAAAGVEESWTSKIQEYERPRLPELAADVRLRVSAAAIATIPTVLPNMSGASWQLFRLQRETVQRWEDEAGMDRQARASAAFVGEEIAFHVANWAANDGAGGRITDLAQVGPDKWVPTPPSYTARIDASAGSIRSMLIGDVNLVRPAEPPAGDALVEAARDVHQQSEKNTRQQLTVARYWSDDRYATATPPGHWMLIAGQVVDAGGFSEAEAAEYLSILGAGLFEAFVNCFHWKYVFDTARPVTVIQRAVDKKWMPYLVTPAFPEWTSGHSVCSHAAATILTGLMGERPFEDVARNPMRPRAMSRAFASFAAAAQEASFSRFYGGIHYRRSIEAGAIQGQNIGRHVLALTQ